MISELDHLTDRISWEPIVEAIRAEPVAHWGYEDAAKIVWNVATRFLPADLETYDAIEATEQHWALVMRAGTAPLIVYGEDADRIVSQATEGVGLFADLPTVHGFTDLVALRRGDVRDVLDWKTAGELDKEWRERLADSWQWRLYCAVYGAQRFIYRGLDRNALAPKIPGQPYDWGKAPMKELTYEAAEDNSAQVLNYLATTHAMREALEVRFPAGRWPRRMPDGCRPYGQRCSHWDVCRDAAPQPEGIYRSKPLSYSGLGRFGNCPESYRLATIDGHKEVTSITALGNAVHRGCAALYDQFNRLKADLC